MFHVDDALAYLLSEDPEIPPPIAETLSEARLGAPRHEWTRSRAAHRTATLAASAGILLAHYEHRVRMPLPETWCRAPDTVPQWVDGVLPEPKYAAFRHDSPIGTFHPGQRAKWTTHELCHRLVGTAWHLGASPLFIATASRLAELVPVVLWYFLDEVGLARCELHDGPLFQTFCPDCEQIAARGGRTGDGRRAELLIRDSLRFVDAELAAIARTKRLGRPVPHVFGSLDLCSDGVAYAAGHGRRLHSDAMRHLAERMCLPGAPTLLAGSIEQLEQRVITVFRAIATGDDCPIEGSRGSWVALDLASRILEVWEQCEGEAADELLSEVDALAEGVAFADVLERYRALYAEYDVPAPEEVFGVGYDIDGIDVSVSRSVRQLREGLMSVCPLTLTLAQDADIDLVAPFLHADRPDRRAIGLRFASWMAEHHPGPIAEITRYEAALRTAGGDATSRILSERYALGDGSPDGSREETAYPLILLPGAALHAFPFDVVRTAERIDAGEIAGRNKADGHLQLASVSDAGLGIEGPGTGLVIARDLDGQLLIAEIAPEQVACLVEGAPDRLPQDVRDELVELGLLAPCRWEIT